MPIVSKASSFDYLSVFRNALTFDPDTHKLEVDIQQAREIWRAYLRAAAAPGCDVDDARINTAATLAELAKIAPAARLESQ